eukprot:COSAG06_NODE_29535_length_554_cov_2.487912_1_plen_41_part_01
MQLFRYPPDDPSQVHTSFMRTRDGEQFPRVLSVHGEPLSVR